MPEKGPSLFLADETHTLHPPVRRWVLPETASTASVSKILTEPQEVKEHLVSLGVHQQTVVGRAMQAEMTRYVPELPVIPLDEVLRTAPQGIRLLYRQYQAVRELFPLGRGNTPEQSFQVQQLLAQISDELVQSAAIAQRNSSGDRTLPDYLLVVSESHLYDRLPRSRFGLTPRRDGLMCLGGAAQEIADEYERLALIGATGEFDQPQEAAWERAVGYTQSRAAEYCRRIVQAGTPIDLIVSLLHSCEIEPDRFEASQYDID